MKTYNNFDLLLYLAARISCESEVDEILAADISDITVTPREIKRGHKIIRRSKKRSPFGALKIALVACLVCLSLAFTACMCIPKVRDAVKEAVLEWYEDHIGIRFCAPEAETPPTPATEITQKAYASYLPNTYVPRVDVDETNTYAISYYLNEEFAFFLNQSLINADHWADSEETEVQSLVINGNEAVLVHYLTEENYYELIWNDGVYMYSIAGYFKTTDALIKIAEGIKLLE